MKRTITLLHVAFLLFLQTLNAQGDFPCATDLARQQALQSPVLFQKHQSLEQEAYDFFAQKTVAERGSQVLTVPVVVHIIHDNGPENLSDAQVQQTITWLNQAFANQTVFDQGSGADVGIQFCLAQRSPANQPTNGITRDQSPLTVFNLESEQLAMKNINRWQPTNYINIWVVRDICSVTYGCGIVAYAYYPSSHGSDLDGIVVEANVINSLANVSGLVHEMGHYFGLYHTFEGGCTNNDCLSDGDRVCDTPPDKSTAAVPCNQSVNTCSTDAQSGFASDQPDMTLNHMDYGHLNCKHDFTEGQADRMNFFLNGARKSLLDSKGCLPPCPLPVLADFSPGDTTILAGQTLFFDNNSQNAVNFSWSLNGVPFGNQQNAAYLFDSAGVFTVQLMAQPLNGQLCEAASAQATVQVTCPAVANFTLSNLSPEEGQTVFVTNTSQNATQFEWFVNGVSQGAVLDSIAFGEAGAYEIRLVAKGSFCSGTATETVFVRDSCASSERTYVMGYHADTQDEPWNVHSSTVLSDGNFLIAGKGTFAGAFTKVFLTKIKPDGTVVWTKLVGRDSCSDSVCPAVAGTSDGGFVALIHEINYYSSLPSASGTFLGKFSDDGNLEWIHFISEIGSGTWNLEPPHQDLIVTSQDEIIVGTIAKFDISGNLLWYNSEYDTDAIKTAPMPDGGFVASGSKAAEKFKDVARYDADGGLLWYKKLLPANDPILKDYYTVDIAVGPDSNIYVLAAWVNIAFPGIPCTWLIKLTPDGDVVWSYRYFWNLTTTVTPQKLVVTESGITVAQKGNIWSTSNDLLHIGFDGKIIWMRSLVYSGYNGNVISLNPISEKGYLVTVERYFYLQSMIFVSGFLVLKSDRFGNAGTGDCDDPYSPEYLKRANVGLTLTPLSVAPLVQPDFPVITLPVQDYVIELDTFSAFTCPCGVEICNNNLDDDEDGLFDCLDPDCNCPADACAPGEAKIWYFGDHAGLDFNTEPPTVLTDGALENQFGSATVCDALGHLLFYTDGDTVFNRFHEPMPNGMNLVDINGNLNPQSHAIVVPHPADEAQYYLFNMGPGTFTSFVSYSLVDMRLEAGKGDVVPGQKSVPFFATTVETEFTAVRSCSFDGYWLLLRDRPNNNFLAFKIGQNGLEANPVFSPGGTEASVYGQMKFSSDGRRVARNGYESSVEIYDFNTATGIVNNPVIFNFPNLLRTLGVEFSPNGRFLYFSAIDISGYKLFQLDLQAGTPDQILQSLILVAHELNGSNTFFGVLQLAPNGKIYVAPAGLLGSPPAPVLHIIHQPNLPAPDCQFQKNGQSLAPTSGASNGLVNIPQNLFAQPAISFSQNAPDTICNLDSTYTYVAEKSGCFQTDSIVWKMEGLSGTLNHDDENGWIKFAAPGAGRLIVTAHTECGIVADTLQIVVAEPFDKILDLGPDQVVCDNGVFTFNAGSGFARYRWQNGSPDSVLTTLLPGQYWVDVWDACGNRQTDTVTVSISPATVLDLGLDQSGCPDLAATFERPGFFSRWQWSPAGFTSCDTCSSVTVSPAATTSWTVVAQTDDGCISVDTLTFEIQDTLFFQLDTSICRGQTIDLFGTTLPADTTAHFFFQNPGSGCDTLLTVNVLGLDAPFLEIEKTVCADAVFTFNGVALPADTTAVFLLLGMSGECDSVITVTVSSWPPLTVTLPPDTTLRIGATLILNAETTGTEPLTFAWSPVEGLSCADCPDPEISPSETILYTLQVSDANGCQASDSTLVTVENVCTVIIPNAFTPNGDGINDFFYPRTDPCVRLVRTWRVVSRWGETVFEKNNFEPDNQTLGWNGNRSNGEPFPSDVLVWYAELEYFDGRVEVRKGDVALLR